MQEGLDTEESCRRYQYAYGINDGVNPVQETDGVNVLANMLTGLGFDEYLARSDSSGTSYFLPDGMGSTLALTDSAGSIQTEYTFEPFGKTAATGPANTNSFQFTGRESDGTGLYYYRARYYHPGLQRFISEDPIEFYSGDINLYAYVGNNPTNFVDPLGQQGIKEAVKAALKGIAKFLRKRLPSEIGKRIDKLIEPDPLFQDDDGDGQPNWMDPDSRHCRVDCDRDPNTPPRPPDSTDPKTPSAPPDSTDPETPPAPPDCGRKDCPEPPEPAPLPQPPAP